MSTIIPMSEKKLPSDCFVFKHSTVCPVSSRAADEVKQADYSLPLYWVNVIEQRPLSNWIAESFSVSHQSPQLLLIRGGIVLKVWNHGEIRREVLKASC